MSDCLGCQDAAAGRDTVRPHSCHGSGTPLAVAIHEVEDVVTPQSIPLFDVKWGFVVQAFTEQDVREKMIGLAGALLEDEDVSGVEFTVTQR